VVLGCGERITWAPDPPTSVERREPEPYVAKRCSRFTPGSSICTVELSGLLCVVTLGSAGLNGYGQPTAVWCDRRRPQDEP